MADIGLEDSLPLWEQLKRGMINMSQYLERMKKQEAELKKRKKPVLVKEHVNLEQADREERARMKNHPAHGSERQIPDRWTSTGRVEQPAR